MAVRSRFVMAVSLAGLLALACSSKDEGIGGSGASAGTGGSAGNGGSAGSSGSSGASGGSAGTSGSGGSAGTTGGSSGSGGATGGTAGTGGKAGSGGAGGSAGSGGATGGSAGATGGSAGSGGTTGGSAGTGGTAGTGGASGSGGAGGSGGMPPGETMGCPGTKLYTVPEDTGTRGPWPVGAKTVSVTGLTLGTEVWYPATLGSDAGQTAVQYDIRKWLPVSEQTKIPDVDNPWQPCNCYRDLPFDTSHGPYPVIIFIHGTAAWRTQSVEFMTHWASRGFVVVSSDHPGLYLSDYLDLKIGANLTADTDALITALKAPTGDLQFLADHIDMTHLGMSGHSAGGGAVTTYGGQAMVLIPLASGGVNAGTVLKTTLIMGGQVDAVANYTSQQNGFTSSPAPKRLVGIANAGHLNFSDICAVGKDKGGLLAIAQKYMVKNANLAGLLFDCKDTQLPPEQGWPLINRATTAAFESVLTCSTTAAKSFDAVKTDPNTGEYKEML